MPSPHGTHESAQGRAAGNRNTEKGSARPATMYHERQHLKQCAVHTLNNLFQERWADRGLMERLALDLVLGGRLPESCEAVERDKQALISTIIAAVFRSEKSGTRKCKREAAMRAASGMRPMLTNPYKSVVPRLGDFDINVVLEALKLRGCCVILHVVLNPTDPGAFELALAEVDWSSTSITGVIVNSVCYTLFWGTWVYHHFAAIVKGPDDLDRSEGEPRAEGARSKGLSASDVGHRSARDSGGICDGGRGAGAGAKESDARKGLEARTCRSGGDEGIVVSDAGGGGGGGEGKRDGGDKTGEVWYSLDSKLPKPKRLGGTRGLLAHLAWKAREQKGQVFVVGNAQRLEGAAGARGEDRNDHRIT